MWVRSSVGTAAAVCDGGDRGDTAAVRDAGPRARAAGEQSLRATRESGVQERIRGRQGERAAQPERGICGPRPVASSRSLPFAGRRRVGESVDVHVSRNDRTLSFFAAVR